MRQKNKCWKTGKTKLHSYEKAKTIARKLAGEDGFVYRCQYCGFRHVTGDDPRDYQRRQAERRSEFRPREDQPEMTRTFYDTEFLEDGETINLISIGLVNEFGQEYYAINADADWDRIGEHEWLKANVLPHLPGRWYEISDDGRTRRYWRPDMYDERVKSVGRIAQDVKAFFEVNGYDRNSHELWAWYGAYDHVALAQLFGRMLDLPDCIPMHTNDLKTLVGKREAPAQSGATAHNALADARWVRDTFNWIRALLQDEIDVEKRTQLKLGTAEGTTPLGIAWGGMSGGQRERVRQALGGTQLAGMLDKIAGIKHP